MHPLVKIPVALAFASLTWLVAGIAYQEVANTNDKLTDHILGIANAAEMDGPPGRDGSRGEPGQPGECHIGHTVRATQVIRDDGALVLEVVEIPAKTFGTVVECVFSGIDRQSFDLTIDWRLPEGRIVRSFYTDQDYVEPYPPT